MKISNKRGFLAKAAALLVAVTLTIGASPVSAQTQNTMPDKSNVHITKLQQTLTTPVDATGVNVDIPEDVGIGGVEFSIYAVPVEGAAGTNEWQNAIANINLETAKDLTKGESLTREPVKTNDQGKAVFEQLERGLYLISETKTPGNVIPAEDFLLTVPLTNPQNTSEWLTDIYVYPKGSQNEATQDVKNAASYVVGDIVTWTVDVDIPKLRTHNDTSFVATDEFKITSTFAPVTAVPSTEEVTVIAPDGLMKGSTEDYEVTIDDNGTVTVTFSNTGRDKLRDALNNKIEQIQLSIETAVKSAEEIKMETTITPAANMSYNLASQFIKYSNYNLEVKNTEGVAVKGAEFRVYLTEEAARAKSDTAYPEDPNGYLIPTGVEEGIWPTDIEGKVSLGGFRDSFVADGEKFNGDTDHENYQEYWFTQISAPKGNLPIANPVPFEPGKEQGKALETPSNSNAFVLPLTGGSGTALLTIVGLGILALVLIVARLRRNAEA